MKNHNINELNNFICGWYIDNTICDELIDVFKNSKNKYEGVYFKDNFLMIDKTIKDSIECSLHENDIVYKKYSIELQKCVDLYREIYIYSDLTSRWNIISPPSIQYYAPKGGYYKWHSERNNGVQPVTSRHLVFMTYLNDVTDEGETEFYYQKIKIKPEKGLTLIWPTDWTFTHRGIPSPSQEKYIVTGWFNFLDGHLKMEMI